MTRFAHAPRRRVRFAALLSGSIAALPVGIAAQGPPRYPNGAVVQTLPAANDPADRLAQALRSLSVNPNDLAALVAAGRNALLLGDPNAAVGFFGRASQISLRDGRIKAGLGSALVQLGQPAQALRLFGEAAALRTPDGDFAADRGLAYDLTGNTAQAQRDYQAVLATRPDDDATRRRLALSQGIAGDRRGAIATLDPLIRKRDIAAWRAQTFVLAMTGDAVGANAITRVMLPQQQGALQPFLVRLSSLTPAEKARAVHFGEMPSAGRAPAPTQVARSVAAVPAPPAAVPAARAPSSSPPAYASAYPPPVSRAAPGRASDLAVAGAPVRPAPPAVMQPTPTTVASIAVAGAATPVLPASAPPATPPTPVVAAPERALPPAPSARVAIAAEPVRNRRQVSGEDSYCRDLRGSSLWIYYARTCRAPLASLALAEPPRRAIAAAEPITTAPAPAPVPATNVAAPAAEAPVRTADAAPSPAIAPVAAPANAPAISTVSLPPSTPPPASPPSAIPSPTAAAPVRTPAPAGTPPVSGAFAGLPTAPAAEGHYDIPHDVRPVARPVVVRSPVPKPAPVRVATVLPKPALAPAVVADGAAPPPSVAARRSETAVAGPRPEPRPMTAVPKVAPVKLVQAAAVEKPAPVDDESLRKSTEKAPTTAAKRTSPAARGDAASRDRTAETKPDPDRGNTKRSVAGRTGRSADRGDAGPAVDEDATGADAKNTKSGKDAKSGPNAKVAKGKDAATTDDGKSGAAGKARPDKADDPSRVYVQVAGGANRGDLDKAWAGVRKQAPDLMKGRTPSTTALRATNRLLVGPFKDDGEAQAFVNRMAGKGVSGFVFKSAKGQKIEKVGGGG